MRKPQNLPGLWSIIQTKRPTFEDSLSSALWLGKLYYILTIKWQSFPMHKKYLVYKLRPSPIKASVYLQSWMGQEEEGVCVYICMYTHMCAVSLASIRTLPRELTLPLTTQCKYPMQGRLSGIGYRNQFVQRQSTGRHHIFTAYWRVCFLDLICSHQQCGFQEPLHQQSLPASQDLQLPPGPRLFIFH